jgi:hypothetical protein
MSNTDSTSQCCRIFPLIVLFAGLAVLNRPVNADTTLEYDPIEWQDRAGVYHPMRTTTLELWDEDAEVFGNPDDGPAGPYLTDDAGFVSMTTPENDDLFGAPFNTTIELYTKIFAFDPNVARVVSTFGDTTNRNFRHPATGSFDTPKDGITTTATSFDRTSDDAKAVAILQQVQYMHNYYKNTLTGLTVPTDVEIQFRSHVQGAANTGSAQPGTKQIRFQHPTGGGAPANAVDSDWGDTDVIFHEFGHLVAVNNSMDITPRLGNNHFAGTDSITPLGNATGTQLAWQEGIATYLGLQATKHGGLDATLPATDRDEFYDDYLYNNAGDTRTSTATRYDIESINAGRTPKGEGDELSVSQILWDLADTDDTNAEPVAFARAGHNDRWALGAQTTTNLLKPNAGANDGRLIDLWGDVQASYAVLPERASELGELFQEYGVSASPGFNDFGAVPDDDTTNDRTPLLAWHEQNSNHSNKFKVAIFDENWTSLILESPTLGNVSDWEVTMPLANGLYNWVVVSNSVMLDPISFTYEPLANVMTAAASYWSGAVQFTVIPEPASIGLALVGMLGMLRVRRRTNR